ncbi:replication protein [Salmonella enterica subsp. enterica serovar Choleraesuis]|nr:replication protein [Salmonella enterica subsp. enterica serovar Choleraesuis]
MSNTAEIIKFPGGEPGNERSNRVENQKLGCIQLFRSVKRQPWAKDVYLRTLWENLLLDAASQPYTANFKGQDWPLTIGQLVTTSDLLGLALCDRKGNPTSRHSVERMLSFFEREGMISVVAERRKGTVITINNYADYAEKIDDLAAHKSAHIIAHKKLSAGAACKGDAAHMSAQRTAHHEQYIFNTNVLNDRSRISKSRSEAAIQTPKGDKWGTADDLQCAEWIAALVNTIKPTAKTPNLAGWANDVRLMRELDGRNHRQICELFRWASKDAFWCSNILSPAKLRAKWDTLDIQRQQGGRKPAAGAASLDLDNTDWMDSLEERL